MRRPLVFAVVGGLVLASLLGAVWVFGGEGVGSVAAGEEMQDSTGATISTDDTDTVNHAILTDEPGDLSNVDLEGTVTLTVTVDEQNVTIENPSETAVSVWASDDETGDEQGITVSGETAESQTLDPGDYTLTGEADDREVLMNGQQELSISISRPATPFSVQIVNVTDFVEVGEALSVIVEITNDGNEDGEEEVALDITDREALDSETVALGSGETESLTLTYQTTEDDIGEHTVTVRSSADTAMETVEVLEVAGDDNDQHAIDSCTEIADSGRYELVDDIEGEAADVADGGGDACIRITASDVVLAGNGNTVIGAGEAETIGILVANSDDMATENVTIRNLRAQGWGTGIRIGIEYDNPSDARLENVIASENEGSGVYVSSAGSAEFETVEANRNGGAGVGVKDGAVGSMVDVTANENGGGGIGLSETRDDVMAERITANGNGGDGVSIIEHSGVVRAERITANGNGGDGVSINEHSGVVIAEDITVSKNGEYGVYFLDVYNSEFSEVTASDNTLAGIEMGASNGHVFRDSTIENNGGPGISYGQNERNEFLNVTVRGNEDGQVDAYDTGSYSWFSAAGLRIGDTAAFAFEEESVSLDDVGRDELEGLPEDARPVGDGVEIEGIQVGVDITLEYDEDENDKQVELWRYDGEEWTSEETVGEADGSIESTLTEDGIYAPVNVDDGDESRVIDSCTVISEPGVYEVDGDVEGEAATLDDGSDACLRIATSDVVLDGTDNAIVGAGEPETVGVLVASNEDISNENVTIRNLRVERWGTGIQIGIDNPSTARLENVIATENEGTGVYVSYGGSAEFETLEANRNGGAGVGVREGVIGSMVDVTANDNDKNGISLGESEVVMAERITANGNGGNGIWISEGDIEIAEGITVSENGRNGLSFAVDVYNSEFSEVSARDNAMAGITIVASNGNVIRDSTIENNGGPGIRYGEENVRNEFLNVTVRENEGRQVDSYTERSYIWFSVRELRIGDTAAFAFEEESVFLDDVDRDELEELPEDARPVGDGVEIEGIGNGVDVILEYDEDENDEQVELWRYDGEEWTSEKTIDGVDGSIESTLTADGIYAPILVDGDDQAVDLDITVDERDVTVVNHQYSAVDVIVTGDETDEARRIEIEADDTVSAEFEPGNYTLRGEAEDERSVTLNGEEELTITVIAADAPEVVVSDLSPQNGTISAGDEINVSATIENIGAMSASQPIEFSVAGHTATETVALEVNESTELMFTWTPNADDIGTHTITVASENESSTTDLVVEDTADEGGDDAADDTDDTADDADDTADDTDATADDTDATADDADDTVDDIDDTADDIDDTADNADDSADDGGESADDADDSADDDGESADGADNFADDGGESAGGADDSADDGGESADGADDSADNGGESADDADDSADDGGESADDADDSAGDGADEDGSGFGIGGSLVGLGGTAYLLKRRLSNTGAAST